MNVFLSVTSTLSVSPVTAEESRFHTKVRYHLHLPKSLNLVSRLSLYPLLISSTSLSNLASSPPSSKYPWSLLSTKAKAEKTTPRTFARSPLLLSLLNYSRNAFFLKSLNSSTLLNSSPLTSTVSVQPCQPTQPFLTLCSSFIPASAPGSLLSVSS